MVDSRMTLQRNLHFLKSLTFQFACVVRDRRVRGSAIPWIILVGFLLMDSGTIAAPTHSSVIARPSVQPSFRVNTTSGDNGTTDYGKATANERQCQPLTERELIENLARVSGGSYLCRQLNICTKILNGHFDVIGASATSAFEPQTQSEAGGCATEGSSCVLGHVWQYEEDRFPRVIMRTVCKESACQDGAFCKPIKDTVLVLRRKSTKKCTKHGKERWHKLPRSQQVVVGCKCVQVPET